MTIAGTSVALSGSISQGTICSGYATTSSLSSYAPLASPTFSGTTTFPGSTVVNTSGYVAINGATIGGNSLAVAGSVGITGSLNIGGLLSLVFFLASSPLMHSLSARRLLFISAPSRRRCLLLL
jgi:hypothetical protein